MPFVISIQKRQILSPSLVYSCISCHSYPRLAWEHNQLDLSVHKRPNNLRSVVGAAIVDYDDLVDWSTLHQHGCQGASDGTCSVVRRYDHSDRIWAVHSEKRMLGGRESLAI